MKALDTVKFPIMFNLERSAEERRRDDSNQMRLNNNFKKISDGVLELQEEIERVASTIPEAHDNPSDYVVEYGSDGAWSYRKWENGECEAWRKTLQYTKSVTTQTGNLYYATQSVDMPAGLFTSVTCGQVTLETVGKFGYFAHLTGLSTSSAEIAVVGATSDNVPLYFHLHIMGSWV